jgi:L-fucose mutarotase
MLKGIPAIISPDLMKILMEMGHTDEIILADRNFPAVSCAKRLIRCDGHTIPELLLAIMPFFPLDPRVEKSAAVMETLPKEPVPEIWQEYRNIIVQHELDFGEFERIERYAFYERTKQAFAVVATSDRSFKGNLLLKKGVVTTF